MTAPLWTILVPTIGQRDLLFCRLMTVLLPQLDEFAGAVQVLGWRNAGERSLGELRDQMVADATGEYVSFIDDDDMVSEHYVAEIVRAITEAGDRPDHVGFQLEYCVDGVPREIVDHSLRHRRWHRNAGGSLVRDFTHVDPIRRELAARGRFAVARRGRAEDRAWCKQVRPHVYSEAYVDKVLYRYLWSAAGSSWQRPERIAPPVTPLMTALGPHFTWHERSV